MINTLLTHLQLFGIGFSFGVAGPCFLTCAPVIVTYAAGNRPGRGRTFKDVTAFLSGRLAAYLILGVLTGFSAEALRGFLGSYASAMLKPAAGLVSILLGILTIAALPRSGKCEAGQKAGRPYGMAGLFALGFTIGVSPCAPLLALLFDIALMSRNWFDGLSYALSFGIGTFLSGLLIIGAINGILTAALNRTLRSGAVIIVFRITCGILLMALGAAMLLP